jgi:helicase MOV-10
VSVSFRPAHIGQVEDTLELQFLDVRIRTRFTIVRKVRAVVGSTQDHEELRPKAPYVKPPPKPRQPRGRVVTLERPPTWTASKWVVRLLGYDIPGRVKEVVDDRNAMRIIRERFMPTAFITQTYAKYFQTLLWVEEDRQA